LGWLTVLLIGLKARLAVAIIPGQHHPQTIHMMVQHVMMMMCENVLHSTNRKPQALLICQEF
jgi:hypothetical protein